VHSKSSNGIGKDILFLITVDLLFIFAIETRIFLIQQDKWNE